MRNLKLQYCKEAETGVKDARQFIPFQCNTRNKEAYCVVTQNKIYICYPDSNEPKEISDLPNIVGTEYLTLDNELCAATENGEVLLINTATKDVREGTFCDVGIDSMTWSPDQEVVVFITRSKLVVVMTCTFEVLAEHSLNAECEGDNQFVNVGWGKKETQFHGTEGKQAAKQNNEFQAPENINELPQNIEVQWRGDCAYFVVSFVNESIGRMFKVFDKEGTVQFTSEKLNGLQATIAWRPTGTWIAVPHLLPNKSTIGLFEKNGLRHREIDLPFDLKVEPIVNLKWNNDSDILTLQTETSDEQRLYFYTVCNYHWYCKQVLVYAKSDKIVLHYWDQRFGEEKILHVLLASGKVYQYKWHFGIDRYERSGLVAVIDGKKLLISNFSKSVIPPPMCNSELEMDNYINACSFLLSDESEQMQLCVYTASKELQIFSASPESGFLNFELQKTLKPHVDLIKLHHHHLYHVRYLNEQCFVATHSSENFNTTRLLLLTEDEEGTSYKVENAINIKGTVNALTVNLTNMGAILDEFYFQTIEDKTVYQVSVTTNKTLKLERSYVVQQQVADYIEFYTLTQDYKDGLISLRTNQSLYMNEQHIAEDVTSCCLAGNYLAFTKLNSLHFVRLKDKRVIDDRKMERGGKLITTVNNSARTILQMPRGNLEAINPRVLALEIVGSLLDRKCYYEVMDIMRRDRINFNIICDHNMKQFVASIETFLLQITNSNWLCLFLSDLKNEDFTKTMYASSYVDAKSNYPEGFTIKNKVNYLCDLLCQAMNKRKDDEVFWTPTITAYVKIEKTEQALELIWEQKQKEAINATGATSISVGGSGGGDSVKRTKAEDLLKYLLYLVDVNDLYNVALGTYNFGLVLFVAQKSQKDPKEYLPFLNQLRSYEINYRKFKIDEHLKRYEKALDHLSHCDDEQRQEEALEFIKKHNLYRQALRAYKDKKEFLQEICIAFADNLRANAKLENASIMYERGGQLQQALLSAKHTLDWQRAIALAHKDKQDVASVALSFVTPLEEQGRYVEAYELLKTYSNKDYAQILAPLLQGRLYLQAIYEARMFDVNNDELNYLDTLVLPDLKTYVDCLKNALIADQELLIDHKTRLLNIRQRKALALGADYGGTGDHAGDMGDEVDILSDTTSMHSSRYTASSRGTGKTFRSSKNRRKHERKVLSLKPGNPFEDIALIDALHNLITKLMQQQQHIRDTCKALLELQLDVQAIELQQQFKELLKIVQDSLDEIWIPELAGGNNGLQQLQGPNVDYTQLQNEQRYALLSPVKRFKPQLQLINWTHEILG